MRIIHFADLHLGIENYGSYDTQRGMSSRVADTLARFDEIVDHAIKVEADVVLFAGDAFKNRDPSPTLQREFAKRIARLSRADIPIVLLVGNHDLPASQHRATHTEIYRVLETPGVHVARDIDLITVTTKSGPLQVVGLPWVTKSAFLAQELFRVMAEDDLDSAMGGAIAGTLKELVAELDPSQPSVLLGHLSIQGATFGFERSIMLGLDLTLGMDELQPSAFDYVALGHIHKHQQVGSRPPAVYAGSPERVDFGEEHEAKGFIDVEIVANPGGTRTTSWTFVELPARRFTTLRVDATGMDPMPKIEQVIQQRATDIQDAVVRCFVEVDSGIESTVPALEIRRLLSAAGASHVARVVIESEVQNRARIELNTGEELDSATMLRRWIDQKKFPARLSERMLESGLALIAEQRSRADQESS
jgi:exonuclease SbcD